MEPASQAKLSKEQTKYTDHGSRQEHCSLCEHYVNPTTCDRVVGRITPQGWCNQFEKEDGKPYAA